MTKIVQIITIPLGKEGWSKDDIIKTKNKKKTIFSLTSADFGAFMSDEMIKNSWQAQQLLVLSDDEIQVGDLVQCPDSSINKVIAFDRDVNLLFLFINGAKCFIDGKDYKKVIASYPHIESTLPIAKETVQAWIDNGTPIESSVEMNECYGKCEHNMAKTK